MVEPYTEEPIVPSEQPTQDELVGKIEESDQSDSGPNLELRGLIETYSKYGPVLKCAGHSVLGAIYMPAIIIFLLSQMYPAFELAQLKGAIFRGLFEIVFPLFATLAIARGLRANGLAERHFGWSALLCSGVRKTTTAVVWAWLPLRVIYVALETFDGGKWSDSLGRDLFIVAMLLMTVALSSTARSMQKWLKQDDRDQAWFSGVRSLLLFICPLVPAALGILSAIGFHFAAIEMSWRALWTLLFIIGISMVSGLVSRLLLITQFGIKLRQLDRDAEGAIENHASIDIRGISQQVNRLIRATSLVVIVVFGWQLWSTVLPAINYLDDFHLWQSATNVVDGVRPWVTLRHLLMALGIGGITVVLSRNFPGLLEITLLDRLPLDRGGRYAISFVLKYLVGIAGFIAVCQVIGFSWSNVQWLAGALMVGLGFGLQEIFANVVSGIIILIERPIRVGDVVTVNNVTGTVTRMQLRATTIKDADFRELIVPNKRFITEDVMNWTLTDRRSRIILSVGVAYGSDTHLVQETLLKVAKRHPLVQVEPPPDVFFKGFGDSTLNFELRVFIPSREIFPKVQHELNMSIESTFRSKNIEIAFPQQDIYIKNIGDFPAPRLDSGGSGGPAGNAHGGDSSTDQEARGSTSAPRGEAQTESPSEMDIAARVIPIESLKDGPKTTVSRWKKTG